MNKKATDEKVSANSIYFHTSHDQLSLVGLHLEQLGGEDLLRGWVVLHTLGAEPGVGRYLGDLAFHSVVGVAAGVAHLLTQPWQLSVIRRSNFLAVLICRASSYNSSIRI